MLSFFNSILSSMPVGEFKMGLLKNSDLIGQIYNTDMFCDRMKIKTLFYIPHLFKIWFKFVDCLYTGLFVTLQDPLESRCSMGMRPRTESQTWRAERITKSL